MTLVGLLFLVPPVISMEKTFSNDGYDAIHSLIRDSRYNEALNLIDEILRENEGDYDAIKYKALVFIEKGDCESAINLLTELEAINQVDPNVFQLRGQCWFKTGKYQLALKDLNKAIEIDPSSSKTLYFRALCFEKIGQHNFAIEDYNRSIEIKPAVPPYIKRTLLLRQEGQVQKARLDLAEVFKLISQDSSAYYDSANILHNMGNYREANQDYKKSIELKPNNVLALSGLAWLYATSEDDNFRDGSLAMKLARHALSFREYHAYYAALAASHAEMGNFKEAIVIQKKAIAMAEKKQSSESINYYREILENYNLNKPWRGNPPISSKEWDYLFSIIE